MCCKAQNIHLNQTTLIGFITRIVISIGFGRSLDLAILELSTELL